MNKDFGRVSSLIDKKIVKKRYQDALQRKYGIKQKGLQIVKEEIRQRINAKTAKISRYQQRINQYQQNRMFKNNESRFYQNLIMMKGKIIKMLYLMLMNQNNFGRTSGVRR